MNKLLLKKLCKTATELLAGLSKFPLSKYEETSNNVYR